MAAYTNLAPGNYVLRLRASNRNGVWTTTTVPIPSGTVQITFEAADAGTASLVEAGVDDVVIR